MSGISETAPLLSGRLSLFDDDDDENGHFRTPSEEAYARFTRFERYRILYITSFATILTFLAEGAFTPNIARIARDIHTSQKSLNNCVALYMVMMAFGGLTWGVYSGYYGRRPTYLWSIPMYIIGTIGVAGAKDIWMLGLMRAIQGLGTSAFATVGAAVISDVFRLEERGSALGISYAVSSIGLTLPPTLGGAVTHASSWRVMQLVLAICAVIVFILVCIWLPETSHRGTTGYEIDTADNLHKTSFAVLNPFKPLAMLAAPTFLISVVIQTVGLSTNFFLLVPMSATFGRFYGIINEAQIGLLFFPSGLGNIVGALLAGWLSDWYIKRGKTKRGHWLPEDRLKAAWLSTLVLAPGSVVAYCFTCVYVKGELGIALNVLWIFLNGISMPGVLSPCNTYGIDIFYTRTAHVVSIYNAVRHAGAGVTSALVLVLMEAWGIIGAGGFFAGLMWFCCILLFVAIQWGDKMRAWKDYGYTVKEN